MNNNMEKKADWEYKAPTLFQLDPLLYKSLYKLNVSSIIKKAELFIELTESFIRSIIWRQTKPHS